MKRLIVRVASSHEGMVLLLAIGCSVASFLLFFGQGSTLGYKDVFSHLEIGRRIVVGQMTGFGQLGGIWLPLQHLLMMPLSWNDTLYLTGLSGSVISMAAYVVSVWAIFKIVLRLTNWPWAAWLGAAVFGLNPDLLYLQATPMGETLMYATMLLSILGLIYWVQTDQYRYLLLASVSTFALTLVRYEGWVMALALFAAVVYACARKGYRFFSDNQKGQGLALAFSYMAFLGVGGWMAWNHLIFGNWLNWLNGQYSSKDQMATIQSLQAADLWLSIRTYGYGLMHTITIPVLVLGVIGVIVLFWRERLSALSIVVLSSLVPGLFLIYGLYSGSQPMQVMETDGIIYNLRFAVAALIPCSILIGYLAGSLPRRYFIRSIICGIAGGALLLQTFLVFRTDTAETIITNREAHQAVAVLTEQRLLSEWLDANTDGRVLVESFENERVVFNVQSRVVYEGTPGWDNALNDPTGEAIDVIVMRKQSPSMDTTWLRLHDSPALADWQLVHSTEAYEVYLRKER